MYIKIKDLITQLQNKLIGYQKDVDTLQQNISDLKDKNKNQQIDVSDKEKKLESIRVELIAFQKERDDIREEVGKKIEELNVSNLSKEEKSEKISGLMADEYQELKDSCQKITQMWKDWGKAKDNLYELKEELANSRLEAIKSLEKTKYRQWIIIWVLLVVVILLSLSLSLSRCLSYSAKKKKNDKREPKNSLYLIPSYSVIRLLDVQPFLKRKNQRKKSFCSYFPQNPPFLPLKIKAPALLFLKKETIGGKPNKNN